MMTTRRAPSRVTSSRREASVPGPKMTRWAGWSKTKERTYSDALVWMTISLASGGTTSSRTPAAAFWFTPA